MAKLKLGTLLGTNLKPATTTGEKTKKQNRRSLSSMAPLYLSRTKKRDSITEHITPVASSTSSELPIANGDMATATKGMVELARKIVREAEKLEGYLGDNNLPLPGFTPDAPVDFPKLPAEVVKSRQEIIATTQELRDLVVGPRESLRWGVWNFLDVLALQVVTHYGIPKLFPIDTTITLTELQSRTSLDPVNLARVLRLAMASHIFTEPAPGIVAHTAASKLLAEDDELQAWIGFNTDEIFPAAAHTLQALQAHPEATSAARTGFQFANGTVDKEPMFATIARDPARARRVGRAMSSLTGGEGYEVSFLVADGGGCDLADADARAGGTFVDVGGSHGFVCVALARRYRRLRFVVQDLARTIESAPKPVCDDPQVADRIELAVHDFFTEQPVRGADVYFFRWIMHNWSTPYAVRILQALIPALKPGARILINDHCLLDPGVENPWDERVMRRMDMVMLALLNAQERNEAEYKELFRLASDKFVFKGVTRSKGCRMSVIEAIWEG